MKSGAIDSPPPRGSPAVLAYLLYRAKCSGLKALVGGVHDLKKNMITMICVIFRYGLSVFANYFPYWSDKVWIACHLSKTWGQITGQQIQSTQPTINPNEFLGTKVWKCQISTFPLWTRVIKLLCSHLDIWEGTGLIL